MIQAQVTDESIAKFRRDVAGYEGGTLCVAARDILVLCDDLAGARAQLARLRADRADLLRQQAALQAEVDRLRQQVDGHCERIAKQSDLLSRKAESAWRPIAEAPRDGRSVPVWLPGDGLKDPGHWEPGYWWDGHWRRLPSREVFRRQPTHYASLPQPPRLGDGGERVQQFGDEEQVHE